MLFLYLGMGMFSKPPSLFHKPAFKGVQAEVSGSPRLFNGSESVKVFQHQQTTAQSSKCPSRPSQVRRKTPNHCPLHLRSSWSFSRWRKYGEISQRGNSFSSQTACTSSRTCFFSPSFQDGNGVLFLLFVWAFSAVNSCIFHAVSPCCDFRHWAAPWPVVALRSGFCQSAVRSASDQFQPKGPTLWSHCICWLVFTLCLLRRNYYLRRGRKSERSRHTGQQDEVGKHPEDIGSCHFVWIDFNCKHY